MASQKETTTKELDTSQGVLKRMFQVFIQFVFIAVILFLGSGKLDWVWAWVYLAVGLGILLVNVLVLPRDLIAERGQPREGVKRWDRILTSIAGLPTIAALVVIALDERFDWLPLLPVAVHIIGLVLFALGQGLFTWAMASNRFFSTLVRIQMDRDHQVASGGPYRFVRHPGYTGFTLMFAGMCLALGSLWALVPTGLLGVLMIVRTVLEDRTLQEELEGYKDYARQVRYRLIPGIW